MASSQWQFRPSALTSSDNPFTSISSRDDLTSYYKTDSKSALDNGVKILPRSESSKLRTLQWNINCGWHNSHLYSGPAVQKGLVDVIRDANADVIVLNEYCSGKYTKLETFEYDLKSLGYDTVLSGSIDYPTAVLTRLKVMEQKEFILSFDRSALLIQVEIEDGAFVWAIGTHLNHMNGGNRKEEIQKLLKGLDKMNIMVGDGVIDNEKERVILMGDLNQQRFQDYTIQEWELIRLGMDKRGTCHDDGVATLLSERGFMCAWDATIPAVGELDFDSSGECSVEDNNDVPNTNWNTSHPPATHWSGTIVDYSYYAGNVSPVAVSISPTDWSDHRMTVCDWSW